LAFSILNQTCRSHIQQPLIEVWQAIGVTVLFITHNGDEPLHMHRMTNVDDDAE